MVAGRYANYSNHIHTRYYEESPNKRQPRGAQDMVSTYKRREGIGSRLVYVPNKYGSDEKSNWIFGCRR